MSDLSLEQFENGVKIYQDGNLYKFTSDSIKLAKFCKFKSSDNVLDMCAGCGVVGFYAYSINPCSKIYFNDIQSQMCDLIEKNIQLNSLQDRTKVICKDLRDLSLGDFDKSLDAIVCNPPYFKLNGKINQDENKAICRHEIATNLQTIIEVASKLLKSKGRFYIVVPSDRMCECVTLLSKNGLEVKNMEIYCAKSSATICLLKSMKGANSGVDIKILKEGL